MNDNNLQALTSFKNFWRDSPSVTHQSTGNMFFEATVIFSSDNGIVADTSRVRVLYHSYDGGCVKVNETKNLRCDQIYLEFSPDFQHYMFEPGAGSLVVEGRSSKVGKYIATITPDF